jgi:hypothetical protein
VKLSLRGRAVITTLEHERILEGQTNKVHQVACSIIKQQPSTIHSSKFGEISVMSMHDGFALALLMIRTFYFRSTSTPTTIEPCSFTSTSWTGNLV